MQNTCDYRSLLQISLKIPNYSIQPGVWLGCGHGLTASRELFHAPPAISFPFQEPWRGFPCFGEGFPMECRVAFSRVRNDLSFSTARCSFLLLIARTKFNPFRVEISIQVQHKKPMFCSHYRKLYALFFFFLIRLLSRTRAFHLWDYKSNFFFFISLSCGILTIPMLNKYIIWYTVLLS